jgi:hypothetical protein
MIYWGLGLCVLISLIGIIYLSGTNRSKCLHENLNISYHAEEKLIHFQLCWRKFLFLKEECKNCGFTIYHNLASELFTDAKREKFGADIQTKCIEYYMENNSTPDILKCGVCMRYISSYKKLLSRKNNDIIPVP